MYYNLPLFHCNVKIWRYFGIIEVDNAYRAYVLLILSHLMIAGEVIKLINIGNDLGGLIMGFFMTVILINSTVRTLVVMKNQKKFIKFMSEIESWYKEAKIKNDIETLSILKKLPKRSVITSKLTLTFGFFGGSFTTFLPLLLKHRALPFGMYAFGLDVLKSPFYEIIYFFQTFIIMPFLVCCYIPFTNLFIAWLLFGIKTLQALRKKLENLPAGKDLHQLTRLKELIRYHKRIIRYTKSLEDLVSFIFMVELLLFGFMLCVLMVCNLLAEDLVAQITTMVYILCIFYYLFIIYWHANEFTVESTKIPNAVYDIDWTNSSFEVRKCVLVLLMRSQTSLKISAGGMYPLTFETLQALLNSAYSFFNLVRGLMAK